MTTVPVALERTTVGTELLECLREVLGPADGTIALHEPSLTAREHALVEECLASTFVSSVGTFVDRFERMLAAYTGAAHAVAVVNGTAALEMALRVAGVQAGDEVLVPALTFVATANAVSHVGAIPHFVDSAPDTLGLDPAALGVYLDEVATSGRRGPVNRQTGRPITAVVPVHTYGHPVDVATLTDLAGRHGFTVVEDAAESLGSLYRGRATGTFGRLGVFSFNGNKIITTGGGGAIVTDDGDLARRTRHLTTTAKRAHAWEFFHDEVAWNYRLPNLNAALGCAQMERLPELVTAKRALAARYQQAFAGRAGMSLVAEPAGARSNYWLNTVRLDRPDAILRDQLLSLANAAGYQCRPAWRLLHTLPMYSDCPRAPLPVASVLEVSLINLPSSARLAAPGVDRG